MAVVLMLVGIGLIGVLTAAVASYFVGQNEDQANADRDVVKEELAQTRAGRQSLALQLDAVQWQLAELLSRTPGVTVQDDGHVPINPAAMYTFPALVTP